MLRLNQSSCSLCSVNSCIIIDYVLRYKSNYFIFLMFSCGENVVRMLLVSAIFKRVAIISIVHYMSSAFFIAKITTLLDHGIFIFHGLCLNRLCKRAVFYFKEVILWV